MSKLTTMQIDVLASACARDDGLAVRPTTLKPAAAAKIAAKLIELGLVRTLRAKWEMPVWRVDEAGEAISLKVLKAGRLALAATMPAGEARAPGRRGTCERRRSCGAVRDQASSGRQERLEACFGDRAALGATAAQRWTTFVAATDWLPHTTPRRSDRLAQERLRHRARPQRGWCFGL